ncbi:PAS-domain containing protein [Fodinicurvata halophila]|uniref:PAS-domain containing protein n=1 Tax=Fodinicurvata halophila TaxID=1419723 RepID=UPI0036341AC6
MATELERRDAEEERLRSARLLQIFFDHMTEGIKVVDKDMQVLAYNRRFLEIANVPRQLMAEEIITRCCATAPNAAIMAPGTWTNWWSSVSSVCSCRALA